MEEHRLRVLVKRPEENSHLEDLSADGRIMSKCVFKKRNRKLGTGMISF